MSAYLSRTAKCWGHLGMSFFQCNEFSVSHAWGIVRKRRNDVDIACIRIFLNHQEFVWGHLGMSYFQCIEFSARHAWGIPRKRQNDVNYTCCFRPPKLAIPQNQSRGYCSRHFFRQRFTFQKVLWKNRHSVVSLVATHYKGVPLNAESSFRSRPLMLSQPSLNQRREKMSKQR